MQYAIVNRDMDWAGQIMNPSVRSVYGPFNSIKEAERYNKGYFPVSEYNLIVPFHPATEED